jgi:hypothetical protein
MAISFNGTIRGRTIEFAEDLGLPEGHRVRVVVDKLQEPLVWGEGILRSAGALADCPEFDRIFEQIEQERKNGR